MQACQQGQAGVAQLTDPAQQQAAMQALSQQLAV
jgi:hypothetical protein